MLTRRLRFVSAGGVALLLGLVAAPAQAVPVNPWWQRMNEQAFGATPAGDVRAIIPTAGSNTDDAIIAVRFFISARWAAGGLLKGDDRGFRLIPEAPSRAVLAWDTETGRVSFSVAHSVTARGNVDRALPLQVLDRETVWAARDVQRRDNRVWVRATPSRLDARLSILNSVTNMWRGGPWSVDNDLSVVRGAGGGYALRINGNGYPAVEVYYYPHYYGTPAARRIAWRKVQPFYLGNPLDRGGGAGAWDRFSWSNCIQRSRRLFCNSDRGPFGARGPESRLDWTTKW